MNSFSYSVWKHMHQALRTQKQQIRHGQICFSFSYCSHLTVYNIEPTETKTIFISKIKLQETKMGTFIGHLVPGLALACLGFWHNINTIRAYYQKGSSKFTSRFWYPFTTPLLKLEHLELILILSFSIFAILIQIFDFKSLNFSFKLDCMEHSTIFIQLFIFSSFTLFTELNNLSEKMLPISGILVSSVFGVELFLLHYHSTDHIGLEGHYHWLMQLIVCASFLASISATSFPTSFNAAIILSISVVFQGFWFVNMGFVLWVRNFVPNGCVMQSMNHNDKILQGAVLCESIGADLRARALANLQFCWILSGILVVMAGFCIAFGRCTVNEQSREYERLFSRGGSDAAATVEFKQIQL